MARVCPLPDGRGSVCANQNRARQQAEEGAGE